MSYGQSRYSGGYPAAAAGGGGAYAPGGFGGGSASSADVTWRQVSEKVKALVLQQVEDECRHLSYTPFAAQDAAAVVAERAMVVLREALRESFKLTVAASVLQRTGAGLHTAQAAYWDSVHDGSTTVRCVAAWRARVRDGGAWIAALACGTVCDGAAVQQFPRRCSPRRAHARVAAAIPTPRPQLGERGGGRDRDVCRHPARVTRPQEHQRWGAATAHALVALRRRRLAGSVGLLDDANRGTPAERVLDVECVRGVPYELGRAM